MKIKPNQICPCGSGRKFKKCCSGKIDWKVLLNQDSGLGIKKLSPRGKNLLFFEAICSALQIDNEKLTDLKKYKAAFTDKAVQQIHESIVEIWPLDTNLSDTLSRRGGEVSGLYIGDYSVDFLEKAVIRHCLYSDKILLSDPFVYPHSVNDEFNPILNPGQYRTQTLENVNRFLRFYPWILSGMVDFIRMPTDFDRKLNWEFLKRAHSQANERDLKGALEATTDNLLERHLEDRKRSLMFLSIPDSQLRKFYREKLSKNAPVSEEEFLSFVQKERNRTPDFLEPLDRFSDRQMHIMSSGGTIEIAAMVAEMSQSYLFTDMAFRWEIIKRERESCGVNSEVWSPFAKAMQQAKFNFLNNIDSEVALRLRKEDRLQGVRSVLRDAWRTDLSDDPFDEKNALLLSENFISSINEAEAEWDSIRAELTKFAGAEIGATALAAGPLIASGQAGWLAGGLMSVAAINFGVYKQKHKSFKRRFPASFFINISS